MGCCKMPSNLFEDASEAKEWKKMIRTSFLNTLYFFGGLFMHPFRTQIEGRILKDEPSSFKTLGFRANPNLILILKIKKFWMGVFGL